MEEPMTDQNAEKKEEQTGKKSVEATEEKGAPIGKKEEPMRKRSRWSRLAVATVLFIVAVGCLVWGLNTRIERVGLLIPFVFILLDYLAFELKMLDAPSGKDWSYEPKMKIWGLGVLLGLGFLLLSRWSEIMGALGSGTEGTTSGTAGTISKAVLTLGVVSLFICGVVKLVGED
jgi:hypothetical protein